MNNRTLNLKRTPVRELYDPSGLFMAPGRGFSNFEGCSVKIEYGHCHCGCGGKAPVAKRTDKRFGHIEGESVRFINGHKSRLQPIGKKAYAYGKSGLSGALNPAWNGGKKVNSEGRTLILDKNHPRSHSNGYVFRSVIMAEKALGKPLPNGAEVHHADSNPAKDEGNLVVCQDHAYHMLLHQRKRAHDACGRVSWKKCPYCKEYDHPDNMVTYNSKAFCHRSCRRIYFRKYKHDKRMLNKKKGCIPTVQ